MKNIIESFKKVISYSVGSIISTSLLSALFSFFKGTDLIKTVFNANYIISAIIMTIGVLGFFMPIRLKKSNRLVDHSNIADVLREEKDIKLADSLINISWGICHIVLAGILEIIIKSI